MLRLLTIASLCLVAFAWLEPAWNNDTQTLSIRVRSVAEVGVWLTEVTGPISERYSEAVGLPKKSAQPHVSAAPRIQVEHEELSDVDRKRLDRLIEEKTREP
ncbi:MAG: hypothetical protein GY725_22065 [bacterium]|nr:hypothetical protein [bacterium]